MSLDRNLRRLRAPVRRLSLRLPRLPRRGILVYVAMMGPGFVTASAGNDAGGIATYAQAGATYGYKLLWAMLITAVSLIVVQEMCARMGAVTGKGLSDLIREEFGIGWAALAMLSLLIANGCITISEFVGINAAARVIAQEPALRGTVVGAILPYAVVILAAAGLWWLVTKGSRGPVERVLLVMTLVFIAYIPAALKGEHNWGAVLHAAVTPTLGGARDKGIVAFLIALVGTTISPYMQFYVQSSVVEKGVTRRDYRYTRVEVVAGSLFAILVAIFIIIATSAALYGTPGASGIADAAAFARALEPVLGAWAGLLFAHRAAGRLAAGRGGAAALHRLRHLRGLRVRERGRQDVRRGADLQRHLYRPDSPGRRGGPGAARWHARRRPRRDAGGQRRDPLGRAAVYLAAGQQPSLDGSGRQRPHLQRHRLGQRGRAHPAERPARDRQHLPRRPRYDVRA